MTLMLLHLKRMKVRKGENMNKKMIFGILLLLLVGVGVAMAQYYAVTPAIQTPAVVPPINQYHIAAAGDTAVDTINSVCKNPDDTDNLYTGGYNMYLFTANITREMITLLAAGSALFSLQSGLTTYISINFTAPATFVEVTGPTYVRLMGCTNETGNVSATVAYNNFTIAMKFEYAFTSIDNLDWCVNITQGSAGSFNNTGGATNTNYDVISTLDFVSSDFFIATSQPQADALVLRAMTYEFYTSTTCFPKDNETDFWVSRAAISGEAVNVRYDEAASYVDATGVATWGSLAAPSVGAERTDTATIYAVAQAGGNTGTSLMHASHTDSITITTSGHIEYSTTGNLIDNLIASGTLPIIIGVGAAMFIVGYIVYTNQFASKSYRPKRKPIKRSKR